MGGQSSKEDSWRQSSSSWSAYFDPLSSYGQGSYIYDDDPQPSYSSSNLYYDSPSQYYYGCDEPYPRDHSTKLQRRYSRIADSYNSIDEVRHV